MKVKLQMVIESEDGRAREVEEVACLKRATLSPEELGLTLAEAKQMLQSVLLPVCPHIRSRYGRTYSEKNAFLTRGGLWPVTV
jgi:hypothetical protein